jgi:hypothetical protein
MQVSATTQVAAQVAQAAHAVHQQAASLHVAAEIHAAKAHAATSQVQSLQATAQVGWLGPHFLALACWLAPSLDQLMTVRAVLSCDAARSTFLPAHR